MRVDETAMPPASNVVFYEVSTVLWRERELLDGLAFSLEMQRLVLVPGDNRWLPRACREVELALDRLRPAQFARVASVDKLARWLDLEPAPTLRGIIDAVAEPWKEIFAAHRRAFLELTGEVVRLAEHNRVWLAQNRPAYLAASECITAASPSGVGRPDVRTVHPVPGGDL
jgi:hypothetical protein